MKLFATVAVAAIALNAATPKAKPEVKPEAEAQEWTANPPREVTMSSADITPLRTRLYSSVMIVLPKGEKIIEISAGAPLLWPVKAVGNTVSIKPVQEKIKTNLNILTAAGNTYSFMLTEGGAAPDSKVFVKTADREQEEAIESPRFVAVEEVDRYRKSAAEATLTLAKVEAARQQEVESLKKEFSAEKDKLQTKMADDWVFDYAWVQDPRFKIQAIYRDTQRTYIRYGARETPVVYEVRDEKPSMVEAKCAKGKCVVNKVIERGYLNIGKHNLHFSR